MTSRTQPLHLRIFLSSPGDVADERGLVLQLLERLQYDPLLRGQVTLEAVAWDKKGADAPLLATLTPQEAINQGLRKPSETDIVVVIFWARLGTPLPAEFTKADGSRYLSGTEWEYEDAMQAARIHGVPKVVVYRRMEKVLLDPTDAHFAAKLEQWQRVDAFFAAYSNPDGSIKQGYNQYATPAEFGEKFETHLKVLIKQLLDAEPAEAKVSPVPPETPPELLPLWEGSPFPGLQAFTPADAPIYFGRGAETDSLLKRVGESRFVAVIGASGSGKSSLVGAGLLPRLASNAIEGSKNWRWLRFTPAGLGETPFLALTARLEPLLERQGWNARQIMEKLVADPASIDELAALALADQPEWAQLLLFIDQFEELFTLVNPRHIESFVALLAQIAVSQRVRAVVTMRSDFYQRCVDYPVLVQLLRDGSFPLAVPDSFALLEMIERPVERAGLSFDEGLARQIVRDTGSDPGALALMAYALDELYQAGKQDKRLTYAEYNALEGVQGAIGKRAETTFAALDSDAQNSLPDVFSEICEVDERGTAIRRRAPLSQTARTDASKRLIDALTNARLLVKSQSEEQQPVVEVAHEALLRSWSRLAQWIEDTQDDLRLLRQVRMGAEEWERGGHSESDLLTGTRLERSREWLNANNLTSIEHEYLAASVQGYEQEQEAERQRQAHELELARNTAAARQSSRRLLFVAGGLLVFLLVGFFLLQDATTQRGRADASAATSAANAATAVVAVATSDRSASVSHSLLSGVNAQQAFDSGNSPLALPLALAANNIPNPALQVQRILSQIAFAPGNRSVFKFTQDTQPVSWVGFRPDGKAVYASTLDRPLTMWDIATGTSSDQITFRGLPNGARAFSPDGKLMAFAGCAVTGPGEYSVDDNGNCNRSQIVLWNVETNQEVQRLEGGDSAIIGVAFSPDSKRLISGDANLNPAILWDVESGSPLLSFTGYFGAAFEFSPSGDQVVSVAPGGVLILWDANSGAMLWESEPPNQPNTIITIAFSPDGMSIAAAREDRTITLFDAQTGAILKSLPEGHSAPISAIAYSPDGQTIASGAQDNLVILWNSETGKEIRRFAAHTDMVTSVAFSPDGNQLLSGSWDQTVRLWDVNSGAQVRRFEEVGDGAVSAAVSPDGQYALSGGSCTDVTEADSCLGAKTILWNLATGTQELQFPTNDPGLDPSGSFSVAFSRDSSRALTAGCAVHYVGAICAQGGAFLWDVHTGKSLRIFPLPSGTSDVQMAAFSPDETRIVTASSAQIDLWDAASGEHLQSLNVDGTTGALVFSPDGKTIASVGCQASSPPSPAPCSMREILLWDAATGTVKISFVGHDREVNSLAFSPDGNQLVSASSDNTLIVWDVMTGQVIRRLSGHTQGVTSVVFSHDGLWMASGSDDKTVIVWDAASGEILRRYEGHTDAVTSVVFTPDDSMVLSGSRDKTLRLWQILTLDQLIDWMHTNRYVRELTCAERSSYSVEPRCDASGIASTSVPPSPTMTAIPG